MDWFSDSRISTGMMMVMYVLQKTANHTASQAWLINVGIADTRSIQRHRRHNARIICYIRRQRRSKDNRVRILV
jgi:hypothetical protein